MSFTVAPISEAVFNQLANFVADVAKRGENGTVIGLSHREQHYRINQLVKSDSLVKKFSNIDFRIIDLKNSPIEDPEDLESLISSSSKAKSVFLISGADSLVQEKLYLLNYFNLMTKENNKVSFIFFFQHNITYPWTYKNISNLGFLFQNVMSYPKYSKQDLNQFVIYLENKFSVKIPKKIAETIIEQSGGHLWLIKEAIRYYAKAKNDKGLFDHMEITFRVKTIYEELEDKERQVYKKMVKGEKLVTDEDNIVLNYLKKTNTLSPLLDKYVRGKVSSENKIYVDRDQKIKLNSTNIDFFLSKNERKAMRFFLNQKVDNISSRDQVAYAIWGKDSTYSDWALDQFVKRLRKKLASLGLKSDLIQTIKNRGFVLNNNQ